MELISLLGAVFIIMLASLAGVVFIFKKIENWTNNNINYLIAFSSGVFLIITFNLITEAFEISVNKLIAAGSIIIGFLIFFILEKIYPEVHCHHEDKKCLTENSKRGANKVLIGDALHNIADGILLAPIFFIDIKLGFIAAIGIFVHEFIQEISEFFILKSAGYTTRQALSKNFLISSTILIGALGGFYLTSFESLVGPLIALSAGAFIYILISDLIPGSIKNSHKEKKYFVYLAWILFGILLILSLNLLSQSQLEKSGLYGHGHLEGEYDY